MHVRRTASWLPGFLLRVFCRLEDTAIHPLAYQCRFWKSFAPFRAPTHMSLIFRSAALALAFTVSNAFAGQEISAKNPAPPEVSPFDKGRMELQIGVTGYHSMMF